MVNYNPAGLDRIFRALGDPTRRALVQRLSHGPALVTELAAPLRMSLPAASKHIRVLERAGLVRRTVRGREHQCRLDAGPMRIAAEWIAHYQQFWTTRLDALEAMFTDVPGEPHGKRKRRR